MQKSLILFVLLVVLSISAVSSADESTQVCGMDASSPEERLPALEEGPFIRADGEYVGEMDLGIRRYGLTQRSDLRSVYTINCININYLIPILRESDENYVFFQIYHFPLSGSIVFRDRNGGSILNISIPILDDRQRNFKLHYTVEQAFSNIFLDVLYITSSWEGMSNGE